MNEVFGILLGIVVLAIVVAVLTMRGRRRQLEKEQRDVLLQRERAERWKRSTYPRTSPVARQAPVQRRRNDDDDIVLPTAVLWSTPIDSSPYVPAESSPAPFTSGGGGDFGGAGASGSWSNDDSSCKSSSSYDSGSSSYDNSSSSYDSSSSSSSCDSGSSSSD
jgi:uncharacterized membrane protein YgcG